MNNPFRTPFGRLSLLASLEGISLLLLVFVAVPLKYLFQQAALVEWIGPVHGALFILFVITTLKVGVEEGWHFRGTMGKMLLASVIPFGTFYINRKLLQAKKYRS